MADNIEKYMSVSDVKIQVCHIDSILEELLLTQHRRKTADDRNLAALLAFTALLAAELKESESYYVSSVKYPTKKILYTAVSWGDGKTCGNFIKYEPETDMKECILEVTRHSDTGGDYTSVICADRMSALYSKYISESLQRDAN